MRKEPSKERPAPPRRGGRPSRLQAGQLQEKILDVATELFLEDGYGATSIEAIAQRARISKRTFYHRFRDKADLFGAVVHRLIQRWTSPADAQLFEGTSIEQILLQIARQMLAIVLTPEALSLHRLIVAEAKRFPELARVLEMNRARQGGIARIAETLAQEGREGRLHMKDPMLAAELFFQMVISVPQRRALGLGTPMTREELENWARGAVALFLNGCGMSR